MLATLERPTTQQLDTTLAPSVIYDSVNHKIHATVIVSQSSPNNLKFDAPIIGIPGSGSPELTATWDVIWTVVPGSGLDSVNFYGQGILIPADGSDLPAGVIKPIPTAPVPDRPDQWTATITHHVGDVNSFGYTMFVQGNGGGKTISDFHDPTIVVTLDPMG
jgi:hypothetical protein